MTLPTIRPARSDEHDAIARAWMASWVSTGLSQASDSLLNDLRARLPREIAGGWTLFVADDRGSIAAMLALHLPSLLLDQLPRGEQDGSGASTMMRGLRRARDAGRA
ncbi:hypothetical protein ABIF38_001873 [Bradyrhizobium japonicum]|nr:hypothetical protein [Bradyrhizobium elkanii]MCS3571153.1 hypothetical protein [Bradyrhizobium elkanii]MCS3587364.1 hypothetical protein [Bradyrhizobium elkanii]MCS3625598.1 hypothetical protein [Bradyrhizobium elkanii]UQD81526.1 hypothetical protein JEY66_00820 [Bradyrhizobium elkanii USDA 76]